MKPLRFIIMFALALVALACNNSLRQIEAQSYPVGYTELNNYYAIDDVENKQPRRLIINTQQEFDTYFGAAAVMGPNGQPTRVDFRRQFVLAVVLPPTKRNVEIVPGEVLVGETQMVFNYRVVKHEKLTYLIKPFTAIAIDKPASDTQMEIIFNQTN